MMRLVNLMLNLFLNSISAKELHVYLGSVRDFPSWFKYQVESLYLIEGRDYSELITNNVTNSEIKRGRGRSQHKESNPNSL